MAIFVLKVLDHEALARCAKTYSPWTDAHGMVIRAADKGSARVMAAARAGEWWLDGELTSCEPVDLEGPPEIILRDGPTG